MDSFGKIQPIALQSKEGIMTEINEVWKGVLGFEDRYKVSNMGNVRTKTYFAEVRRGLQRFLTKKKGKLLKPQRDKRGRMVVFIGRDGKTRLRKVHQLVLEAFIGPCPEGQECRHLNGNPSDNRLENLCWGTHIENCKDRDRHGTTARGDRSGASKITEDQAREIHALYKTGNYTYEKLSKRYGVTSPVIAYVVSGKGFKHLGLERLTELTGRGQSTRCRGEWHGMTKLTENDVRELRRQHAAGVSVKELGGLFGVHHETARSIALRKCWKHVV